MNIFIIGGTGLLGCEAAKQLILKGHKVTSISLRPHSSEPAIPKEMEIIVGDINKKTDEEILDILKGKDIFIFAAGVDERVEFPPPVIDYYKKYNIAPLERLFPLCKQAGIKRSVVLGSYFSYLAKQFPDDKFEDENPYIMSRLLQEQVCEQFSDDNFGVCVLELPYIFGTQPGRKPVWTILIEQIAFMDSWPATLYPRGGTAMLTCRQTGEVICGAALNGKSGFEALPISMTNMKWYELLKIVYKARGMGENRRIIGIYPWMMKFGLRGTAAQYEERGIQSGINPLNLPYIMDKDLFISDKYARECGATDDDIVAAITDSIKLSVQAYNGDVDLIEMKCE